MWFIYVFVTRLGKSKDIFNERELNPLSMKLSPPFVAALGCRGVTTHDKLPTFRSQQKALAALAYKVALACSCQMAREVLVPHGGTGGDNAVVAETSVNSGCRFTRLSLNKRPHCSAGRAKGLYKATTASSMYVGTGLEL